MQFLNKITKLRLILPQKFFNTFLTKSKILEQSLLNHLSKMFGILEFAYFKYYYLNWMKCVRFKQFKSRLPELWWNDRLKLFKETLLRKNDKFQLVYLMTLIRNKALKLYILECSVLIPNKDLIYQQSILIWTIFQKVEKCIIIFTNIVLKTCMRKLSQFKTFNQKRALLTKFDRHFVGLVLIVFQLLFLIKENLT